MSRLIWADVETTGTNPARHFAWDVALIVREDGLADAEHQWFIKPDLRTAEPMALRVGHYYERTAGLKAAGSREKAPKWADPVKLAPELAALLDGAVFIGQNPWFDASFISALLLRHGQVLTADYHYRDIGSLVTGFLRGTGRVPAPGMKLDALAACLGLDPLSYERHSALGDVRLERDMWDEVWGGDS
jgi:DNA polymerase III epsilon subunit-like protein